MTRFLCSEQREDGEYLAYVDAETWADAEAECQRRGLTLKGEFKGSIEAGPGFGQMEADALIASLNNHGPN